MSKRTHGSRDNPDQCPDLRVLSYGGGTQSAALALMSVAGLLPRLDAVVFADTEGELPETYAYAEYVQGHLDRAGIPFIRVSAGSLEAALLSPVRTTSNPTPPAHVLNPDGSAGKVLGYRCSYDFKRRVVTREVKRLANERGGKRGAWKRMLVEQWLGFSVDEITRCKETTECRCGAESSERRNTVNSVGRGDYRGGWSSGTGRGSGGAVVSGPGA